MQSGPGVVLEEDAVCEVHKLLSGQKTLLGEILVAAKRGLAVESVEWLVPVTPRTVHRLSALYLLATDAGISVSFMPAVGLDPREASFHDDFLTQGVSQRGSFARRFKVAVEEDWVLLRNGLRILRNVRHLMARRIVPDGTAFDSVLLIGQYGGEHVGDIAILGGVLLRLRRDCGTQHAYLLSHRPDHTRRLADGLDVPVHLTVQSSDDRQVEADPDEAKRYVDAVA